jgi:hypothetical protein
MPDHSTIVVTAAAGIAIALAGFVVMVRTSADLFLAETVYASRRSALLGNFGCTAFFGGILLNIGAIAWGLLS